MNSALKYKNSPHACSLNYPLLIDHILRKAKLYLSMVLKLQSRADHVLWQSNHFLCLMNMYTHV